MKKCPEVLTIAGTDSGGGAGMMADIKTMQTCHVFSTCVVTGVTAQNTLGVQEVMPLPTSMIDEQFNSINADFSIKAAKTGALFNTERVDCVVENIHKYSLGSLVLDPVMIAKGGAKLLADNAIEDVINKLIPISEVITPNLPEAETIVGYDIKDSQRIKRAAKEIQKMGATNVIIKGGHSNSQFNNDYVLLGDGRSLILPGEHIESKRKHGTGDTLSSVIVAEITKEKSVEESIRIAKNYLNTILNNEIIVGHGHGPLNHWGAENTNVNI